MPPYCLCYGPFAPIALPAEAIPKRPFCIRPDPPKFFRTTKGPEENFFRAFLNDYYLIYPAGQLTMWVPSAALGSFFRV